MNKGIITCLILLLGTLLWEACTHQDGTGAFEKTAHGITIQIDTPDSSQAHLIQLDVITNNIIHVKATPDQAFKPKTSLMVLPDLTPDQPPTWEVTETDGFVTLATPTLHAMVSVTTGEVVFTDSSGQVILQEQPGGGKQFEAVSYNREKFYHLRQIFQSPDDEAFYGLGAHQNGQVNYKGEDVALVQHNIVDVIPFLYSSKNYGLLWDNYSISHFGDPRDYEPLSSLTLYDRAGEPGGLSADYYVGDKVVTHTTAQDIDFEYLETPQLDTFPQEIALHGKMIWEGSFSSEAAGRHKFLTYASGYCKVWVDQKLVVDRWRQNWNPWTTKFTVDLAPNEKHTLKIEWTPEGGYLALKHLAPYPAEAQKQLSISSEAGHEIDYYFIQGQNADDVIHGYRLLTGKAPIVPQWALGFWQSRERYRNQQELLGVVKEYRKRHIPLDNIVLDWQYWEDPKWGSHEFDLSRFPDPKAMINTLHNDLHAHIMISVWPKFNKGTQHYEAMKEHGFLFTHNIDKKRKDWVGEGYESTFYDPFNPEAGKMFWQQIDENLNQKGIDAWWLDATEPDMHSNLSLEERKANMNPTAMGPAAEYFNAYSLMNSKGVYEGQRHSSPDKRVFILTRSAYAGQQRYGAATWSGDVVSRWSNLREQIAAGINFSLSGIPYWTHDIGGFSVEKRYENATGEDLVEWRELQTRWFQFGAFSPLFRSHGQFPYREIYHIAPPTHPAYKSMVYYTQLRYRLMPYLYSLAGDAYWHDGTLMRGLIMDFNADPAVDTIADEYMLGKALLINPVYTFKARTRQVYLPAGTRWYDLYTGQYYTGGQQITAEAPLERIPVFIKAGSIIPVGPAIAYTGQQPAAPITLYVYTGADAHFTLYEDEKTNYNYEAGKFTEIPLSYEEGTGTLNIGARQGDFSGMLTTRSFRVVTVTADHPTPLPNATPTETIEYNGTAVSIKLR